MADEHRLRARGPRLRRVTDPTESTEPRITALMAQLEELSRAESAVLPRAEFRSELRAQLVAITPRIVAEHAPANGGVDIVGEAASSRVAVLERPAPAPASRAGKANPRPYRDSFWRKLRDVPIGRPLAIAASIVAVLALVLGGAVYMSRDAVPGDTLYGLKRASERVELSFADNDTERAQDYLKFAATRVDEARTLATRASASAAGSGALAGGRLSDETADLITDALQSADGNTQTATRLLGGVAIDQASPGPLDTLTAWAPAQLARLAELRAAVPADTKVVSAAGQSTTLVTAARARATSLKKTVDCDCLQNAPVDSLGPLPISTPTTGRATPPSKPTTPTRSGGSTTGKTSGATTGSQRTGSNASNPASTPSTTTRPPLLPLPRISLPGVPKPSTTQSPILDLCKVNLLGVRLCSTPSK